MIVYEPVLSDEKLFHSKVIHDLDEFKKRYDVIVVNLMTNEKHDIAHKVYTIDLFGND